VGYLAAHGEIPEMIVVGIASTKRVRDFTQSDWPQVWIGGGGAANFKRFLSAELLPEIEKTYRTDGFRVLSGHSASGQFVLYCLTAEPSLFRGYLALSPSLDWDDNLPQRSLEKSFDSARTLQAFVYVARSDDSGRPLADFDKLVATLETKAPKGLRWRSQAYPDETHSGLPLLGQIDALRSLFSGYRYHNDLLDKGLQAAQEHFKAFSKTLGWPVPVPERVMNGLAYAALSQGKHDEAIAIFKNIADANPHSANAYDGLADGYAGAKQWREAVTAAERALALAIQFDLPNRAYFETQSKKMKDALEHPAAK